jgi:hypothetical protein
MFSHIPKRVGALLLPLFSCMDLWWERKEGLWVKKTEKTAIPICSML